MTSCSFERNRKSDVLLARARTGALILHEGLGIINCEIKCNVSWSYLIFHLGNIYL